MSIRSIFLALVLSLGFAQSAFCQTIASKVEYVGTSRHLEVTGVKTRETNGLLNLYVEVSNSDYDDQEGYYRIEWLDEAGFPAWEDEAWKPILVHGGQKLRLQMNAPTKTAQDFKIIFSGDRNWAGNMGPAPVK
jgi:uncharacterized protein YcfL